MADDQKKKDEEPKTEGKKMSSDSGLGNLPPLSDFDSQGGFGTPDSGLPPLGSFDSDTTIAGPDRPISSEGGLPPISDIDVVTPQPTGGNIRPAPPGFDSGPFASSGPGIADTPARPSRAGSGFQDLAADSDFSPETPEIGPGPGSQDSGLDTPMFDSAFGGGAGFDVSLKTPAPTQAMETPMFGGGPMPAGAKGLEDMGFGPQLDFTGGGTPAPDFSPDTDMRQPMTPVTAGEAPGKKAKKGGGKSSTAVIVGLVALVLGIIAGPYIASYLPLPNPQAATVAGLQTQVTDLNKKLERFEGIERDLGKVPILDPAEVKRLQEELAQVSASLKSTKDQLDTATTQYTEKESALQLIEADIGTKNEEFVTAQEMYQDLQNETAIVKARQSGLLAEVERLTGYVGELDEANVRRMAAKEALEHNVDRLIIQIKEGMPLTPEKYSHAVRLSAAESLRDSVAEARWITPELQQAYTDLYLKELEIASKQEYFFARLPVHDELGTRTEKWAECLMKGNWGVYFRTLDGKNVGVYQNTNELSSTPVWAFHETLAEPVRKEVEQNIIAARVPDFEAKVRVLAEKQLAMQESSGFQRSFDSL